MNRSIQLFRFRRTIMRRLALLSLILTALICGRGLAADAASNTLTDAEKAAGWKLLFDGKTTNGWRNYKKPDIAPGWKVEEGALVRGKEAAGDIITADQ